MFDVLETTSPCCCYDMFEFQSVVAYYKDLCTNPIQDQDTACGTD